MQDTNTSVIQYSKSLHHIWYPTYITWRLEPFCDGLLITMNAHVPAYFTLMFFALQETKKIYIRRYDI